MLRDLNFVDTAFFTIIQFAVVSLFQIINISTNFENVVENRLQKLTFPYLSGGHFIQIHENERFNVN